MIYSRPLKNVLGKIIPFGKDEVIHPSNLGSGVADSSKVLLGNNTWADKSSLSSIPGFYPEENVYALDSGYRIDESYTYDFQQRDNISGLYWYFNNR